MMVRLYVVGIPYAIVFLNARKDKKKLPCDIDIITYDFFFFYLDHSAALGPDKSSVSCQTENLTTSRPEKPIAKDYTYPESSNSPFFDPYGM